MYATKNPVIIFTQVFAIGSAIIFVLLFMLLRQQFTVDPSLALILTFSCLIGLICSFILLYKFEQPTFAFPGISIHLLALNFITCC